MPRADIPSRTWDPFHRPPRLTKPSRPAPRAPEPPRQRRRRRVRTRVLAALLFGVLAVQLGRPELGFFVLYLVVRAVELYRADGGLRLSTIALWSTGVGTLLIYARSEAWASVAEVALVLFGAWVAGVGRREHPGFVMWVFGPVVLVACLPLTGVPWFVAHGVLALLLLVLTWSWIDELPHAPARMLAEQFGGRFDLESGEIRIPKGDGEFVGLLYGPKCTGPMPPRAIHEGAVTVRACDCDGCRSFDPEGESQTTRVDVDGHTLIVVQRGIAPIVDSVDQGELRALLRQLSALPHGKAVFAGGEMTVRAAGAPREVREAGSRVAAYWSCRTGEQVFRLTFALYDYLERSATQTYR